MTLWVRFEHARQTKFGVLDGDMIAVHEGDMFAAPRATGESIALSAVALKRPCDPAKMFGLWNNFHALATKINSPIPAEPLYFLKNPASFADPGGVVRRPGSYDGKIVYEGELGIVIGRRIANGSEADAEAAIFGYTCVNDITALDIITRDATFAQWARAKGFDGFGPFGPAIATGLDVRTLHVRTILDGQERQNYSIADMVFSAAQLVSRISHDTTLDAGDIISCGTSVGVGTMKRADNIVEVEIAGIGTLRNSFVQDVA